MPGLLLEGAFDYYVSETIYLSLMNRFQLNPLNESEFLDFYRRITPSNVSTTFDSKPWCMNSVMGGIGSKTFLDEKTELITRFLIGFSNVRSPSFETTLTDGITTITESQSSVVGMNLSYLIGLGVNFKTNDGFNILLSADYHATTPDFSNVRFIAINNGTTVVNESFSFTQEIRLINLSLGIAIPL